MTKNTKNSTRRKHFFSSLGNSVSRLSVSKRNSSVKTCNKKKLLNTYHNSFSFFYKVFIDCSFEIDQTYAIKSDFEKNIILELKVK